MILRASDTPATWDGAVPCDDALCTQYRLVPFVNAYWLARADPVQWVDTRIHEPDVGDGQAGLATRVPTVLGRSDARSGFDPARAEPFLAQPNVGRMGEEGGLWILDPVWQLPGLVELPDSFSSFYCFNYLLGIDTRTARDCLAL